MSELRFDPLNRRWVVMAPERRLGPRDFVRSAALPPAANCPLCPGNERHTGHEILALRDGAGKWRVRVVPNKFPVLRVEGELQRWGQGLYDLVAGVGAHEVVVESADHARQLADLGVEALRDVLRVYRDRLLDLRRDARFRYILLFKNHGLEAGAKLDHSHSQLVATPEIPNRVTTQLAACRDYFYRKERCLLCDVLRQEGESGSRLVLDGARYVAFVPFAAASPFQVLLCPRGHSHDYALAGDEDLLHLASALGDVLGRLRGLLEDPAYNLVLHTAPPPHPRPGRPGVWDSLTADWHWYLEIVPRITQVSGFELGTGFYINPVAPEEAAQCLRAART